MLAAMGHQGNAASSSKPSLNRRLSRALIAATVALLPGCASSPAPEVKVIHSHSDATPIERAYLIVFQGKLEGDGGDRVRQALADAFQPRVAALASMVVSGFSLDEGAARADIDAFRPDGVVVIKPAADQEGRPNSVTYDVAVLDRTGKRTVWQAKLVSEGGPAVMARDLVKNLAAEGLLKPKAGDERRPEGESGSPR
jgi:hypothetical protein